MTNKKRKTLVIILVSAALLIVLVFTVFAYLGNQNNKSNTFTLGTVGSSEASQITETFSEPSVMQVSNTTEKKVSVTNNSNTPAYARLYVDFSDKKVRDKAQIVVGNTSYTWDSFINAAKSSGINGWKYVDSSNALGGYFYYTQMIEPSEHTTNLFDGIETDFSSTVADGLTSADYIDDFGIIVYSEIVQITETDSSGTVYDSSWATINNKNAWEEAWKSFLKVTP